MDSITLSFQSVVNLRSEAYASIRYHAAEIVSLSSAITDLDTAIQWTIAESRSIDEQQHLVDAARRLASLLERSGVACV